MVSFSLVVVINSITRSLLLPSFLVLTLQDANQDGEEADQEKGPDY